MKINTKRVVLRPLRPGFLSIIPRLPSIVSKNQILFKIVSPITYVIRSIKNIFKKTPTSQINVKQNRPRKLQIRSKMFYPVVIDKQLDEDHEDYINNCGDYSKKRKRRSKMVTRRTSYSNNAYKTRSTLSTVIQETCVSCREDCAPNRTCPLCRGLNSSLPASSCDKCQKKGPLVNFCMCFHNKRPLIFLPEDRSNYQVGELLDQRGVMMQNRKCNGKSPTTFNCPMCFSIQPSMGECGCKKCRRCRPLVQLRRSKNCSIPMVYMCPCPECIHLRPKTKICEPCRTKQNQISSAKSYYAIIL